MEKQISAADANRKFSEVLREVRDGHSYVVTSHGKAVARINPARDARPATRAKTALMQRLLKTPVQKIARWTRDELYED